MELATYTYLVDWDGDESWDHAYSDISAYVLNSSWRNGRPSDTSYDSVGALSIILDNSTAIFSSFNSSSPLYGLIRPNLGVRVSMALPSSPSNFITMFQGAIENIIPQVGQVTDVSTANLTGYGILRQLTDADVDVALQEDETTGDNANTLLDAISFPAGSRSVDTGQSTLSKWWVKKGTSALQAIRSLQDAELGRLREGKDGKIAFENRHHIFAAPHSTPQATYGTGTLRIWDLKQGDELSGIYNAFRGNVRVFNHSEDSVLVIASDVRGNRGGVPPIVPGSGSLTQWLELPGDSPYIGVYSWSTVDYEANTAADGTGTDITADVSAVKTAYGPKQKIVFTNSNGSDAHLILLRAHGIAIIEDDPIPIRSDDSTSQSKYQKREWPNPSPWLTDQTDAQAHGDYVVSIHKDPRPKLTFSVKGNYDSTHLSEVQNREIGDRIRVLASTADFGLGIDAEFIIDSIAHSVNEGREHVMSIGCTKAPASELSSDGTTYTAKTISSLGVPADLSVIKIPLGLKMFTGAEAKEYNETIFLAEMRAKYYAFGSEPEYADLRTVAEGGSLVHDGSTELVITDLDATYGGVTYTWTSGSQGTWFLAYRFQNAAGWSLWSDGNPMPTRVVDRMSTEDETFQDNAPPSDWNISIEVGPIAGTVRLRASRPASHCRRLLFASWQIKDITQGSPSAPAWRDYAEGVGAADLYYDGSGISHTLDSRSLRFTRDSGSGFGTAFVGCLIAVDVRANGSYDTDYTLWGFIAKFEGDDASTATWLELRYPIRLPPGSNYRIKSGKSFWGWNSEGYMGDEPGSGWISSEYYQIVNADGSNGDMNSLEFISPAMPYGSVDISHLGGRVIFQTGYSGSDDNTYTSNLIAATSPSTASYGYEVIIDDASTIASDARLVDGAPRKVFYCLLTSAVGASRTLGNTTGAKHRQPIWFIIRQSATGGNDWSLDSKFRATSVTVDPNTTADMIAHLGVVYDKYDDMYDVIGFEEVQG